MKSSSSPLADFSSKNVQNFLILLSWVIYIGVLLISRTKLEYAELISIAAIPVLSTGWLTGTRKGFIAAILGTALHIFLKIVFEHSILNWQTFLLHHFIGIIILILASIVTGYLRDLNEHQWQAIRELEIAKKKLSRYGELLNLINQPTIHSLSAVQWENKIADFVTRLGQSAQVERVWLYEIPSRSPDSFLLHLWHYWCRQGSKAHSKPQLQKFTPADSGIGFWVTHAREGQFVTGQTAMLPPADKAFLSPIENGSFLVFPVFALHELWGIIGFETSQPSLMREQIELDAIRTLVMILGNTIHRKEIEETLSDRAKEIQAIRKSSFQVSSTDQLETTLLAILEQVLTIIPACEAEIYLYADHKLTLGASLQNARMPHFAVEFSSGSELAYSAARKNEMLLIPHIGEHPLFQNAREYQAGAAVALPLTIAMEVVGVMNVWFSEARVFPKDEVRMLHLFGNQAALAINNTEYFKAEQEQRKLSEALREANLKLTSNLDLSSVLSSILEQCLKLIPAQDAHIFLYDGKTLELGAVIWRGSKKQEPMATPRENGLTYSIARSGTRLLVPNMKTHELFTNAPQNWKGAIIGLPLKFREKVIGVMNIAFSEPRSFTKKTLQILDLLGDQAALAINNARIFETEKKQRQIAEVLQTTGQIIKSSLDLDTVLDRILTQLKNIIPYDTANLVFIEQEKVYAVRNLGYEKFNCLGVSVPKDLSQELIQFPMLRNLIDTQQPAIIPDTASDSRWIVTDATSYVRSWAGVPLLGRDGVIGILLLNKTERNFYKPKHAEWITVFANQAAIAIDNARLFEKSQQSARELKSLHQATSTLVSTLDLNKLLENILTAAIEAFPAAEKGSLMIHDPETQKLEIRAAKGYTDERIKQFAVSTNNGYAALAFKEKKAKIFTKIDMTSSFYYESEIAEISSIQSAISVPLISQEEQPLGVLSLDSTKPNAFATANLEMLSSFAAAATSAILNAQLHAKVQKLAITDTLTHSHNRRGLFQWGEREFMRAKRFNRALSVIFLDLDHFKQVNDTYGHGAGDQLLAKVVTRCQQITRQIDILGRYGGEEFVIILPETAIQEAFTIAERIRKIISASPFIIDSMEIKVTISLGVAEIERETQKLEDLIKMADQSMYHSKQNGRNQTTRYN